MPGMNRASRALGDRIHAELIALILGNKVRPVVGLRVPFAELPAALEAMARRETVGRVVVEL
jgi:NADPH2:quinone reductase